MMTTNSEKHHRLLSKQRKLNTTPLSIIVEPTELLPARKKGRSPTKKRTNKDEIKYQHFVHDLKKDIRIYMNQCLCESRFDTRANSSVGTNSSHRNVRATVRSRKTASTIGSYETETNITPINHRQNPMSLLKHNETQRLADDVQTILTGPAIKTFYTQFIRPVQPIPNK